MVCKEHSDHYLRQLSPGLYEVALHLWTGKLRPREVGKSLKATQLVELERKPEAEARYCALVSADWGLGHWLPLTK